MPGETLPKDDMTESNEEFEVLYESNAPLIYRFMFWRTKDRMLAEDLTSNVFEKAWRSRGSFTGGSATAWLYKIARNTLIDHWRKRHDLILDELPTVDPENETKTTADVLDQEMLIHDMQQAVAKLPKDMRRVVTLRFIEGLSARQTSHELGLSESNVRVIQYRALRKLRDNLQ